MIEWAQRTLAKCWPEAGRPRKKPEVGEAACAPRLGGLMFALAVRGRLGPLTSSLNHPPSDGSVKRRRTLQPSEM
jgi:hypothetical protein